MRKIRTLSVTFLLLAAPAFAGPAREIKPTRRAAAQLAKLFPGSKVLEDGIEGSVVLPIKRRGLWGYGKSALSVKVPGGSLLVFELTLAKITKEEVVAFNLHKTVGSSKTGLSSIQTVVGMILLDKKGKFRAKPEGWPQEAEQSLECMGDFCATGVWIRELLVTRGDGSRGFLTLNEAGDYMRYPYQIKKGKILLGLPMRQGSEYDGLAGDDEEDEGQGEGGSEAKAPPPATGTILARPEPGDLAEARITPFKKNEAPWSGVSPPHGPRRATSGRVVIYDDNSDDVYLLIETAGGKQVAFLINDSASSKLQEFTETANEQKGKTITLIWRSVDVRPEGDPEMLRQSRIALDLR